MSPWLPIIVSLSASLLLLIWQIYDKVTTSDETKEHLRKLKSWAPATWAAAFIILQIVWLIQDVNSKAPLTRLAVLSIALFVGSIILMLSALLNMMTLRLIGRVINVQKKQIDLHRKQIDIVRDMPMDIDSRGQ